MKSWLSYLLPDDEYKEKRLLYFIAEGAILQIVSIGIMLVLERFFGVLEGDIVLLLSSMLFIFYVTGRYIFAGIEYTEVTTEQEYKKELGVIRVKSIVFVVTMTTFYFLADTLNFVNVFDGSNKRLELVVIVILSGILMFLFYYISLKRSFNKNKELL